jgi:hypothetical protein
MVLLRLLPPPPPLGLMMKARPPMQPGWGITPNRGWHTCGLDDLVEWRQDLRAPLADKMAGQRKGTCGSNTLGFGMAEAGDGCGDVGAKR